MEELKIVGWTSYDSEYPNLDFSTGVIQNTQVVMIIVKEIIEKGYVFGGDSHQNDSHGVPLFSNGCVLRCSMRAWGFIMAMARQDSNEQGIANYMNYYMQVEDEVLPSEEGAVEKGPSNDALPMIIGPDQNLIQESIMAGVELMTTDKAIKTMYPLYKMKYGQ